MFNFLQLAFDACRWLVGSRAERPWLPRSREDCKSGVYRHPRERGCFSSGAFAYVLGVGAVCFSRGLCRVPFGLVHFFVFPPILKSWDREA